MLPQSQPRKKRNSSKVNLLISFVFHATLVLGLFYFAARQGYLGEQLKKISVQMVKEKRPHKPPPKKPKLQHPKVQPPKKVQKPKATEQAKAAPPPKTAPPPAATAPPTVAPPPEELPSFEFAGGKAVVTSSDPVQIYKNAIEAAYRSKWNRPQDIDDSNFVAEVRVSVGRQGQLNDPRWKEESKNARWNKSVRQAVAAVTHLDRPPPTNFPSHILVRFDVRQETEPVLP